MLRILVTSTGKKWKLFDNKSFTYGVISGADFIKHEETTQNSIGNINFDQIHNHNLRKFPENEKICLWWKKEPADRCVEQFKTVKRASQCGTSIGSIRAVTLYS